MSFLTVLAGSKIAVGALTFGTLAAGGTAAVAYAGDLPSSLQQGAHSFIGAPAPTVETEDATTATDSATDSATETETGTAQPSPSATPVGPDATGSAAFGLCNAYTHGGLAVSSTAYDSLMAAADGADNIKAYCDTIVKPGQSDAHRPDSADAKEKGKSDSQGSTDRAEVRSRTATKAQVSTEAELRLHVGEDNSHKPATAGRH